jgi:hypothetical protein
MVRNSDTGSTRSGWRIPGRVVVAAGPNWAASWVVRKQREEECNGGAGRARLSDQPGFGPLPNRSKKILFLFLIFS